MATVVAPVELPTGRRSYYDTSTTIDIHDPNWIPMLDNAIYKPQRSPTVEKEVFHAQSPASFSLFPMQATSPKTRSGFSHTYSKSSLAPESVTSDSDSRSQSPQDSVEPLPSIPSSFQFHQDGIKGHNRQMTSTTAASNEEKMSVVVEAQGDRVSGPNADEQDNSSVVDDRASIQQTQARELSMESTVSPSMRSSITSTKKGSILPPTSKYNRKPIASTSGMTMGRPSPIPSAPQTPVDSPRLAPAAPLMPDVATANQAVPSPKLPPFELAQHPEPLARLQAAKSTASDRRQRALHSHPSNLSLRSRRNSSSDDAEIVPKPPSIRKPRKSTDSRATTPRSTIYDSQMPTPAPTTPLPQLPPEAHVQSRRPSTRDNGQRQRTPQIPAEEPVLPALPAFRPFDHSRVASFMTEKNTVVLRRFDDVHARLLLSLQDEISQLEQELERLESPNASGTASEKILARTRIMRELRKVVAEYDHLYNTWSKMQTNKMTESTTNELKQWLGKPGTDSGGGEGVSTQQNLQWLEKTKDLSSIELGDDDNAPSIRKEQPPSVGGNKGGAGGGGGGFLGLFNCAGKRK